MSDKQIDKPKSPVATDTQANTKPSKPAAKPAKKPAKAPGTGMAKFLALLAILIALAASAFGYQQLRLLQQQLADQQSNSNSALPSGKQFDTFKENMAKRLDSFKDQQHLLQGKVTTLEGVISTAADEANRDQRGWVLAEAEYLMNMANSRLRLLRDVKSAIEALKGADQRIASLADPALFPVQEALAEEISNLQTIGIMDSNSVALKLINLGKLVRKMPPAKVVLGSDAAPKAEDENPVLASLLDIIGAQKNQRPFNGKPTQVDILSIDQLIQLDLNAARHAVLRFDAKAYTSHLDSALNILKNHYDQDNQQVELVKEELLAISARKVFPTLPDISQSSSLLNTSRNRYTPANTADSAVAPAQEQTL